MSKTPQRKPQFFLDDDSGEPWQLFGSADNPTLAVQNFMAFAQVAIDQWVEGGDGEVAVLRIKRVDMAEAEVEELPDLWS